MNQAAWMHTLESGCECLAHKQTHETQITLVLVYRRWAPIDSQFLLYHVVESMGRISGVPDK